MDGLDKLGHMQDILRHNISPYSTVLMGYNGYDEINCRTWQNLLLPYQNRLVDDTGEIEKYKNRISLVKRKIRSRKINQDSQIT